MRRLILALGLLGISATGSLAQTAPPPEPQAGGLFSQVAIDGAVEAAQSWLELSLFDYETARIRDVHMVLLSPDRRNRSEVVLALCGLVNARNRMDGYTGFEEFYHTGVILSEGALGVRARGVCSQANRLNDIDYADRLNPRRGQ